MRFYFKDKKLEALYTEEKNAHKYPNVIDDFFEVLAVIGAASDKRDLYAQKGLRFEKLAGKRGKQGQRSLRLNQTVATNCHVSRRRGRYIPPNHRIEDYH